MGNWKDNISFILVEPKEPGNVGASVRAMKNMGFRNLELVKPGIFLTDEARQMAYDAIDVLENAKIHSSFREAIQDKTTLIGTTRRIGRRRGLFLSLRDSIKGIITAAKKNRIAILFGREDKGLKNQEVEECGFLITIPSDTSSPSLNLAQSVLVVAYELSQGTFKVAAPKLVSHQELDALYRHIQTTLELLEYIPRGNRKPEERIIRNLKHLIGRSGLTHWELRMLYGLCSQVEKKIKCQRQV
jgi:TrmH family RNA methyltransferase